MNLYEFKEDSNFHRFTTAKTDVMFEGNVYTTSTLRRSKYILDTLVKKNNISIRFLGNDPFARDFLHPTTRSLTVTIRTLRGVAFYRGRLVTVRYNNNLIDMVFEQSIRLGNEYSGERRIYQRNCPYELYGRNCNATRYDHRLIATTYLSPTSLRLQFDTRNPSNDRRGDEAFAVLRTNSDPTAKVGIGRLVGGVLSNPDTIREYWITKIFSPEAQDRYVNFSAELFRPHGVTTYNQPSTDVWLATFGCLRTTNDCQFIHDNLENFGGFAGLVKVSPFSGGIRGG